MKKLNLETAEMLAAKMRGELLRISGSEPINMKTTLRQLNVMTMYRPLSDSLFGLSLLTCDRKHRFMLVNSNSRRGRQHFTIAHELYHLYFDENPQAHFCTKSTETDPAERSANLFASALLMPKEGLWQNIPSEEIVSKEVSIDTMLRLEQLYGVSHTTLVIRLKELHVINAAYSDKMLALSITREAAMRGYDASLYASGNEGVVIGDFGSKARKLFDEEKISEGHYNELLNMIGYGEGQDCIGC